MGVLLVLVDVVKLDHLALAVVFVVDHGGFLSGVSQGWRGSGEGTEGRGESEPTAASFLFIPG
ncbi:hypothetical protein [Streptomyces sp. NPDC046161]|uniref:hypothetical protein n=1 Tax=Streptomyces sp. NPDC046161 TaxID=3155132 RepID=UPI0033F46A3B